MYIHIKNAANIQKIIERKKNILLNFNIIPPFSHQIKPFATSICLLCLDILYFSNRYCLFS